MKPLEVATGFDQKSNRQAEFNKETKEHLGALYSDLETLKSDLVQFQEQAAKHSANIGLLYYPEQNECYIISPGGIAIPVFQLPGRNVAPEAIESDEHLAPPSEETLPIPVTHAAVHMDPDKIERDSGEWQPDDMGNGPSAVLEIPPAPPDLEYPKTASRPLIDVRSMLTTISSNWDYFLSIFVALFVGYGLGTLAGFNMNRFSLQQILAYSTGFAVIYGLKMLLRKMYYPIGRHRELRLRFSAFSFIAISILSLVLIILEAFLGANALVQYSIRASFEKSDQISLWIAFPIAMVVTWPLVLISAFKGYQEGRESITQQELRQQQAEREDEERKKEQERGWQLAEQESKHRREQDAERLKLEREKVQKYQSFLDEWRELKREEIEARASEVADKTARIYNHPDYSTLLECVALIEIKKIEVTDKSKSINRYKISRGYTKLELR